MTSWNPYGDVLERVSRKTPEELKEYVFLRLAGREADPKYDWSRNQETPEEFLIWANSAGDEGFRQRLADCLRDILDEQLGDWLAGNPGGDRVASRVLYTAEVVRATSVTPVLQEALIEKGRPRRSALRRLLAAAPVPWGETLLHQSLGALSILEREMPRGERRARKSFWRPILVGPLELSLPKNLRTIALRSLGRMAWRATMEEGLAYVIDDIDNERKAGRSEVVLVRELAALINFFVQESVHQEAARTFGGESTLIEDPTPLVEAFCRFATRTELLAILKKALVLVASQPKAFGDAPSRQKEWVDVYISAILGEILALGIGNVARRVRMGRIAKRKQTSLRSCLAQQRLVLKSAP